MSGLLQSALAQRLRQHMQAQMDFHPDAGNVPVLSGMVENMIRGAKGAADLAGLGRDALQYADQVGAGEIGMLGNALLNPDAEDPLSRTVRSVLPAIPGLGMLGTALQFKVGRDIAGKVANLGPLDQGDYRNAATRFQGALQHGANPIGALQAADQGMAQDSPFATGVVEAAVDPLNFIPGVGEEQLAARGAGRIGAKLGMTADAVQKLLYLPENVAGHAVQRIGGAAASKVVGTPVAQAAIRAGIQRLEANPKLGKAIANTVHGIAPALVGAAEEAPVASNLHSMLGYDAAEELQRYFPAFHPVELENIINAGMENQPAIDYAQAIAPYWDKARAGQMTADDVIASYIPAVLSQQRKGQAVGVYLNNKNRAEQLGTKYPELRALLAEGTTIGGKEHGKYRPEDLAALMLHYTAEGRELGSALKRQDPDRVRRAMDAFNAIWPDAGFRPGPGAKLEGPPAPVLRGRGADRGYVIPTTPSGQPKILRDAGGNPDLGETGALIQAATEGRFQQVADKINEVGLRGGDGAEVAQWLRDNNVLPRIGEGKAGFLTTNLGGPAATFDVRVEDAMNEGRAALGLPPATREEYERALGIMFPEDDLGLAHHKFWDSQSINKITGAPGNTPHKGLLKNKEKMADEGYTFPLTPRLKQMLGDANTYTDDVTPFLANRPQRSYEDVARQRYQREFLDGRAQADIDANKQLALGFYQKKVKSGAGFDQFWDALTRRLEDLKTISMGVGDAGSARAIADSGMGIVNGFKLRGNRAADGSWPESLVAAKARALGLSKGQPRYDEALAYGEALGIKDPAKAVQAYSSHFLDIEAKSFDMIGAGMPGDPESLMPTYASITEGQPALNQMGGSIHLLFDPDNTDYVASIHHPFMMASQGVMPMHKGTSANLKNIWGQESQAQLAEGLGRDAEQTFGPEGDWHISGTPLIGSPAATSAIRAASLIATDGGEIVKKAATNPEAAAVELLRGGLLKQRGPATSLTRNLAGNSSAKRSEALVMNPDPKNVTGILVKGQTADILKENVSAARYLTAKWGIPETPIYVAYGPEGSPGRVYELTQDGPVVSWLNKGREALVNEVNQLGLPDYGVAPQLKQAGRYLTSNLLTTPGSSRLAMTGAGALVGGTIGAATADDDQSRREAFLTGAGVGGGLAFGATTGVGNQILRAFNPRSQGGQFAKNLLLEAVDAQRRAWNRSDVGFTRNMPSIWKVQLTSTLRNLLQDEASTRLFLANDGVKIKAMNQNWSSLIDLYNQGKRGGFEALPEDLQIFLDKWGKHNYMPDMGANFATANKQMVDKLSALDLAKGEALLSLLDPTQGGIPVAGAGLGFLKGLTRPFQQSLFDTLNSFTRIAGRSAAFQDEAEKGMLVAGRKFLSDLQGMGINVNGLDVQRGFDRADVTRRVLSDKLGNGATPQEARRAAAAAGRAWEARTNQVMQLGEENAKRILGNFEKKLPGEKVAGSVMPFIGYTMRAYPRVARMMLDHPGVSIMLTMLLMNEANAAKEQGLPGYVAGSIGIPTDMPVVGGIARGMLGGEDGTAFVNPLGMISPVDAQVFSGPDEQMPGSDQPNLYQKALQVGDRVGLGPTPIVQALTYAMNKDFRKPGRLSRTGAIEEALPGPQVPSLTEGALNFAREQAGGTAQTTTPLDRKIAEVFYRMTGVPIGDPSVDGNPELRALRDSSLDQNSPIYKTAQSQLLQQGVVRTGVGYTSPATVSALSDIQQQAGQDRHELLQRPAAQVTDEEIMGVQQAQMPALRKALILSAIKELNKGTQADLPASLRVNRGASTEARAKAALAAWQAEHQGLKGTPLYQQQLILLHQMLGLQ